MLVWHPFQLQAETGRGVWGARGQEVSIERVRNCIESVAGRRLPWDAIRIGTRSAIAICPR